ncbi:NAD(P)H-binding protein [Aliagarivorans marinus]|uniref:NAD(P)H-binding protein n=1 Tax=Aliagarivorans marinus TaxID=561965 RepID=UPI00040FCA30|nr:NAD(P)H-binding protein [Aliagarivorans marinus]
MLEANSAAPKQVVLAGASGLIGQNLLALAAQYSDSLTVNALYRHPPASLSADRHTSSQETSNLQINVVDWQTPQRWQAQIIGDCLWLCLGTSKHAKGSYQQVDLALTVEIAICARAAGVKQCIVVSSTMASLRSPSRYLRVKAQMEGELQQLQFPSLVILRPGPLLGREQYCATRWDEQLSRPFTRLLAKLSGGQRSPLMANPARQVAQVMINETLAPSPGTRHYAPYQINQLAF